MNETLSLEQERGDRMIAVFGRARLVRTPEGRHELRGGTFEDRTAAKEWISLCEHEVLLADEPTRDGAG